jgi:hypothetical protein
LKTDLPAGPFRRDQTGISQGAQVFDHCLPGHGEAFGQLSGAQGSPCGQLVQNRSSGWVGEGGEDALPAPVA